MNVSAGSFETLTSDGIYGTRWGRVGFSVSGAARRTSGPFEHAAGHELIGGFSADGAHGGLSWRWTTSAHDRQREDPGFVSRESVAASPGLDPLFRFDEVDRQGLSTALTLRHDNPFWRPQIRLYATTRNENLIRSILVVPNFGDRRARDLSSVAVGGRLDGEHTFVSSRPLTLRFGMDLLREQLDTSYRGVSQEGVIGALDTEAAGSRVRAGVFVSSSWGWIYQRSVRALK